MARKRRRFEEQLPLGPDDDPYLAYLIWREQRDAEQPEAADLAAPEAQPARRTWTRKLALWRRDDTGRARR
jgi:hypothetical protein